MPLREAAFLRITVNYLLLFSHFWFATPQLVLQADWQEVWHSPQPPFLQDLHRSRVFRVLILSMFKSPLSIEYWLSRFEIYSIKYFITTRKYRQ